MQLEIRNLSKRYANGVQALAAVSLDRAARHVRPARSERRRQVDAHAHARDAAKRGLRHARRSATSTSCASPSACARVLGYLPQDFGVYPKVSAYDLLDHLARLKGLADAKSRRETVEALLHRVNLHAVRKQKLGGFSGGMRQRFGIAQALIGNPKLVIVDEPTAGLDPEERVRFHNLLADIASDVVVILSTHIVSDVEDLCAQFAVINQGQLLLTGEPGDARRGSSTAASGAGRSSKDEAEALQARVRASCRRGLRRDAPSCARTARRRPGRASSRCAPDLEDVYFCTIAGYLRAAEAWLRHDTLWAIAWFDFARRLRMVSTYVYFVLFAVLSRACGWRPRAARCRAPRSTSAATRCSSTGRTRWRSASRSWASPASP